MKKVIVAALVAGFIVGCGSDGDSDAQGSVSVNGDGNEVFVVDGQFDDCSGNFFRFITHRDSFSQEFSVCADGPGDQDCEDCFDDEYLQANGYLSNEGCVEERVLRGECGSEQLIAQAQAAAESE